MTYNNRTGSQTRSLIDAEGNPITIRTVCLGPSLELARVEDFAKLWGLYRNGKPNVTLAVRTLDGMGVRVASMPDGFDYYNPGAVETAMTMLTRFGGPGFNSPNSWAKRHGYHRRATGPYAKALNQVTEKDIKKHIKGTLAEMEVMAVIRSGKVRKGILGAAKKLGRRIAHGLPTKEAETQALAVLGTPRSGGKQ